LLLGQPGFTGGSVPGPEELARSIQARQAEQEYDEVIVDYLHRLAKELKESEGHEAESVREQVDGLVRELDEATLKRLLRMGGNRALQHRFLLDVSHGLAVQSVIRILNAAASSSNQTISDSLARLLSKLSVHAESGPVALRAGAALALRENVEGLLRNWDLSDPNPDHYTLVLDALAQSVPFSPGSGEAGGDLASGALRLVQMSLEVDTWGPTVAKAAADLMDEGQADALLSLLVAAPPGSQVGRSLCEFLAGPDRLEDLLAREDLDEALLRGLGSRLSSDSIPLLMEALSESESRSVRRRAFDLLSQSGPGVEDALMARLSEPRWYVVRNMLALGTPEP
ncbi:hypothetical protein ACFL3S_12655, partial [Gemmatimonadota bacterium]